MFKLILSDNTEIPVSNGSTLFDIMVEPVQYSSMWNHLTERNLKHVRLVSGNGDPVSYTHLTLPTNSRV